MGTRLCRHPHKWPAASPPALCSLPFHRVLASGRSLLPEPIGLVITAAISTGHFLFWTVPSLYLRCGVSVSTLEISKLIKNNLCPKTIYLCRRIGSEESSGIFLLWTLCIAIVAFQEHGWTFVLLLKVIIMGKFQIRKKERPHLPSQYVVPSVFSMSPKLIIDQASNQINPGHWELRICPHNHSESKSVYFF